MASMAPPVDAGVVDGAARGRGQRASCGRRGSGWRGRDRPCCGAAGTRRRRSRAGPCALSKMETRTLSVPKSTPATMLIVHTPSSAGQAGRPVLLVVVRRPSPGTASAASCTAAGYAWTGWRRRGARSRSRRCSAAAPAGCGISHHAGAAEGCQRIVGELALADVAARSCPSQSLVEKRAKLIGPAFTRPTQVP